jgi:ribonuclease E
MDSTSVEGTAATPLANAEAATEGETAAGDGTGRRRRGRRGGRRRRRQEAGAGGDEAAVAGTSQSEIDFDDEDGEESEGEFAASDAHVAPAGTMAPVSGFSSGMPVTSAEADFDDLQLDMPVSASFEPERQQPPAAQPVLSEAFEMPRSAPVMAAPVASMHVEPRTQFVPEVEVVSALEPEAPAAPVSVEAATVAAPAPEPDAAVAPDDAAPIVATAPIYVPAPAPAVVEAAAPPAAPVDTPTPADAAAMAVADVDDAGTLAAAGDSVDATPAELSNPPRGGAPTQVETDADSRSPLV